MFLNQVLSNLFQFNMSTKFNTNYCCPLCNRKHAIRVCSRFIVMPVEQKLRVVSQNSLCYNCLAQSHTRETCKSIDRCWRCRQDHNSLLHPTLADKVWVKMTAHIQVIPGPDRKELWTRALIDPTAARSAITLQEAQELGCVINRGRTVLSVCYRNEKNRRLEVEMVVEAKRYGRSPSHSVECDYREDPVDGSANRYWHRSLEYYIVFGSDVMSRILEGRARGKPGHLYVQDTIFGLTYFGEALKKE